MPSPLRLRVTVLDTWDESTVRVPATTLVSDLKRTALAHSHIRRSPAEYVVKYRGAELPEAGRTLGEAGVVSNSGLIVLLRRRLPVR